jgi:hypothetical protein
MHNTFSIETEAAFRRAEWERAVTAATRAAQAPLQTARWRWSWQPNQIVAGLLSLLAPRVPITCSWSTAPETRATNLFARRGSHRRAAENGWMRPFVAISVSMDRRAKGGRATVM